jgi:tetraacyldisaccharide-1-P 4'-kinase
VTRSAAASPQAVDRRARSCAYALERQWYAPAPTLAATLLRPLAALFAAGAALRRAAYRRRLLRATRVRVPVIVVGNIAVGGSGKTPLVIALAEALRARGRRPGTTSATSHCCWRRPAFRRGSAPGAQRPRRRCSRRTRTSTSS